MSQNDSPSVGTGSPLDPVPVPDAVQYFSVRPEVLPSGWPKFLRSGAPVVRPSTLLAELHRTIVRRTYPLKFFQKKVEWSKLHHDEQYACVASIWTMVLNRLQFNPELRGRSSAVELLVRRMYGCCLIGYDRNGPDPRSCGLPVCPYCYARRVGYLYTDLLRAFQRRPEGSKIYVCPFLVDAMTRLEFQKRLRAIRPAAGAYFLHPLQGQDYSKKEALLQVQGVMLSDSRAVFKGRPSIRRVHSRQHLSSAVARWFWYPRLWSLNGPRLGAVQTLHMFASLPPGMRLYQTHGAASETYRPGCGHFDFTTLDPASYHKWE